MTLGLLLDMFSCVTLLKIVHPKQLCFELQRQGRATVVVEFWISGSSPMVTLGFKILTSGPPVLGWAINMKMGKNLKFKGLISKVQLWNDGFVAWASSHSTADHFHPCQNLYSSKS